MNSMTNPTDEDRPIVGALVALRQFDFVIIGVIVVSTSCLGGLIIRSDSLANQRHVEVMMALPQRGGNQVQNLNMERPKTFDDIVSEQLSRNK